MRSSRGGGFGLANNNVVIIKKNNNNNSKFPTQAQCGGDGSIVVVYVEKKRWIGHSEMFMYERNSGGHGEEKEHLLE